MNRKQTAIVASILFFMIVVPFFAEARVYQTWCRSFQTGGNLGCDSTINGVTKTYTPGVAPFQYPVANGTLFSATYSASGYQSSTVNQYFDPNLNSCALGSDCTLTTGQFTTVCDYNGLDPWICDVYQGGVRINWFYLLNDQEERTVRMYRYLSTGANAAPILFANNQTMPEDSNSTGNAIDLHLMTSEDSTALASLSYALLNQTNASIVSCGISSGHYLNCTPQANQTGYSELRIRVADLDGASSNTTLKITVSPIDDHPLPPTSISFIQGIYGGTNNLVNISCSGATDVDGDALTYNFQSNGTGSYSTFALNDSDGIVRFNVSGLATASAVTFRCNASDLNSSTSYLSTSAFITADNSPPALSENLTNQNRELGSAFSYQVNSTDMQNFSYAINATSQFSINATTGAIINITYIPVGNYTIEINATDLSGNVFSGLLGILVADSIAPAWNEALTNQSRELGIAFGYDANATDLQNITYRINDTIRFTINSSTGFISNSTFIPVNNYTLQINATDLSGNTLSEIIIISIIDTITPSFVENLTDQSRELGTLFFYDANATDLDTISYSINDTLNFVINATTGIIMNATFLAVGNYTLEINATDASGNDIVDSFILSVIDTTAPSWIENLTNQTRELGVAFNYDVNATDLDAIAYSINDTFYFLINASTGVISNATFIGVGIYPLIINATDASGNTLSTPILAAIADTTPPVFSSEWTNQTRELGNALFHDINASDLDTITFSINDTSRFSINSSTGILVNATFIPIGEYPISLNVTDASNNVLSDLFILNVTDTVAPVFLHNFTNETRELGVAFFYDMNASDLDAITYSINDSARYSINASTGVITNATFIPVGRYTLLVNASDASGNTIQETFSANVTDTTAPLFTPAPENQTRELGEVFEYDINATDLDAILFAINDTSRFAINSTTGMVTNSTSLTVGNYSIEVNATDASGNRLTGSFIAGIIDTTAPVWLLNLTNQSRELGIAFSYDVNATDLETVAYTLNDTARFSINSTTGLITNATFLAVGGYPLRINATDASGNVLTETISLSVSDTTAPSFIQALTNQTRELGEELNYDVNATDLDDIVFAINDTLRFRINSSLGVITNATFIPVNNYSIAINATDASGNVLSERIIIGVIDTIVPSFIENLANQDRELGERFFYDVNGSDLDVITYSINDTAQFAINASTGVISNATLIPVSNYTLMVNLTDPSGNRLSGIFGVRVTDTVAPLFVQALANQTRELGTAFSYDVNASDLDSITYSINDTLRFLINSSSGFITNATFLAVGNYTLEVNATDASNNTLAGQYIVSIIDTAAPDFANALMNQTKELGDVFFYDVNATDLQNITYLINNTAQFTINAATGIINATYLAVQDYSLEINVSDLSGNVLSGNLVVIVIDSVSPVWAQNLTNQSRELGIDFSYDVNATDLDAITYAVNDTARFAINATSGLISNGTLLGVGNYSLAVNATDASSNRISQDIIVIVIDTTSPEFTDALTNQSRELGSAFSYDVNASDLASISYSINDTSRFSINSSTGLIVNSSFIPVNNYTLQVNVSDASGNVLSQIMIVEVIDTTAPFFTEALVNQDRELGEALFYDVNASDLDDINFTINDTARFTINLTTGMLRNATLITVGNYSIGINATDASGNVLSATLGVRVTDTIAPVFLQNLANQTQEYGVAFNYDINATDLDSIAYSINDTASFFINSSTGLITNATSLAIGNYSLRVNATDPSGNILFAGIYIFVVDTTIPLFTESFVSQNRELGEAFFYDVNSTDLQAILYSINDTLRFRINGTTGVLVNNTFLAVSNYTIQINATDASGNAASGLLSVRVTDTVAPFFVEDPTNQSRELGIAFAYDLNASDLDAVTYRINDTSRFLMNASTGFISNGTFLAVGSYHLSLNITDASNNQLNGTFIVSIIDTTAPTFSQALTNQTRELGESFFYDINATDLDAVNYTLNDTLRFAINAATGVIVNATFITVNNYTIQINATDASGNVLSETMIVGVVDTIAPSFIEELTNQGRELGQGFYYDVNGSDLDAITYAANDTIRFAMNSSTGIIANSTFIAVGNYTLEVNLTDPSGNRQSAIFGVRVTDSIAPTWTQSLTNQSRELGEEFYYDVNATDLDSISYAINDTLRFSVNATTGVIMNATFIPVSNYTLEINATDASGNRLSQSIIVTIIDTTAPVLIESLVNQTTELGSAFSYDVNASDLAAIAYSINATSLFAINQSTGLITNITSVPVGNFTINVSATDLNSNMFSSKVIFGVVDTTAPEFSQALANQSRELGQGFFYDLNATDLAIISYSINNTAQFSINATDGSIRNATLLAVGSYHITANATDASMNTRSGEFIITVNDTVAPAWTPLPSNQSAEYGVAFSYDVNATDHDTITYRLNDTLRLSIIAGTGLITNTTGLAIGQFDLELNATDPSSNNNHTVITITIADTVMPTWVEALYNHSIELGVEFGYDVNATDIQAVTYAINDTSRFTINASGQINNATYLPVANYGLKINATDSSGNTLSENITIRVIDTVTPTLIEDLTNQTRELGAAFHYDVNGTDLDTIIYSVNDTGRFLINASSGSIVNSTFILVGGYALQVNLTDASGNAFAGNFTITIIDTTAPLFIEVLANQTRELGEAFSYDVNASDLASITFTLNDSARFLINSSSGIIMNATFLGIGNYTLEVNATDASGNKATSNISIGVIDTIFPVFDHALQDQVNELGSAFFYDINATDFAAINYSINDTVRLTINLSTGLLTNATFLQVGNYTIEVNATDASNNILSGVLGVLVRDTIAAQFIETPTNQEVEIGVAFTYDVNATDFSNITFTINNTLQFAVNATSGLIQNATFLNVGSYALRINATDASENVNSSVIVVSVGDSVPPAWVEMPSNQTRELGIAFAYDVNATDLQTVTYRLNDTARFSIIAGTGLITNATFLPVGSFDLLLNATDASSRTNSTNITITIIDTIAPSWAPLPSDQVVEVGDAVSYDLNAADLATIAYSINDTARFIIDNGTGLISNSTFISAGNYSINASAIDPSSNVNSTSFIIEARDTRAPQVTNSNVPLSKRFNETFNITVDAYDFTSVANVSVEINGTNRSMTSLAGTTYYYTITNNSLVNDTFILRFHANDTFGNMNSSITATFTIVGPTNNIPSITSFTPSSGSFIYEGDQLNISAGAVDSDGTAPTIILYRNATALTNASANLSYEWLTSNQDAGIYNFTACASDGIDSSCQSNIYTVLNKALPNLSSVSPLGTVFTSRQNITITPDRPINASTVLLTLNGVPVNATASSSAISYFAQLPEGVNTLNATASDLFNNTESFDWSFTVDITGSLSGFVFFGGSGVTGANVSVYNESGIVSSSLTYATGEIITPFTLHEGNYSLNISANGYIRASSHFNMTGANRQINTSLSQEPDAMVHSINVSGNYLMEYQNITITSIVGYSGDIPRNSTIRLLYANNTEIMNSSIQFTNSSNQSVSLQWIAQTGTFDFKVAVDRAADEAYTANNAFFKYGVQARDVQNTLYSYFFVVSTTQSSNSNLSAYLSLENLATSALVDLPVTLSAETGLAIISSATQNVNLSAGEIKWISWSVNTTGYNTTLDDPDRLNASVFGEKIANISISNSQDGGGFGTSSVGENTGFEPESNSSISLNFNYGNHSGYDEDNDGSANLSEVVDFTLDALIAQSIDPATLCTLYRIYSEEDATLTSACYGAKQCCQFVGLAPYQNAWDSDFYLAYGLFGSTEHNLVEAKVISVDYDLRISYLYVDIDYSNPQTLEANFTEAALSQLNVTYEPTASHEPITSHDEESPAFTNETMPAGDNAENPESNNTQMGAS